MDAAITEEALSIAQFVHGQPKPKKVRTDELRPIVFAYLNIRKGKVKTKMIKCLLDTGASGSLIAQRHVKLLNVRKDLRSRVTWSTPNGSLQTQEKCTCIFTLPEFYSDRAIQWTMHAVKDLGIYDMIIGRDMLSDLGIKFDFTNHTMSWDDAVISMQPDTVEHPQSYFADEPEAVHQAVERLRDILDAKYEKADLDEVVAQCDYLTHNQKHQLLHVLNKFSDLFDGTLGKWNMGAYDIQLRPGVTPYHAKPYPIPYSRLQTLKT